MKKKKARFVLGCLTLACEGKKIVKETILADELENMAEVLSHWTCPYCGAGADNLYIIKAESIENISG